MGELTDEDYKRQLDFRLGLVRFLSWNRQETAKAGVTPTQHLLLLLIRGFQDPQGPTIGDVASALHLRHHSAVELADRAEEADLVERIPETFKGRAVVRLRLTQAGRRAMEQVVRANLQELRRISPQLMNLLTRFHPPS